MDVNKNGEFNICYLKYINVLMCFFNSIILLKKDKMPYTNIRVIRKPIINSGELHEILNIFLLFQKS